MKNLRRLFSVLIALAICLSGAALAEPAAEMNPLDAVREIVTPLYEMAVDVAQASPELGRGFTDHKLAHAEMVAEKSVETATALRDAVLRGTLPAEAEADWIPFSADVDLTVVAAAGLAHDTGMCGGGYAISDEEGLDGTQVLSVRDDGMYVLHPESLFNFSEIRTYHSLNSCMYVLLNRERYLEAGFTDAEVDRIAAECAAHSKSSSGVRNLNSRTDWSDCFTRIDSMVEAHNEEFPDQPISFNRATFEEDVALMSVLATETLALRVGDVSRDSGPDAEVQTGEHVHVDRDTLNNLGDIIEAELAGCVIVFSETGEEVLSLKSRQVHAGEQNIVFNRTYADENGTVIHEITITDGCSAPRCTQSSIGDHLGEFYSARNGQFAVEIVFESFSAEDTDFFRDSWEDFRLLAANDYPNIELIYPWDKEAQQ